MTWRCTACGANDNPAEALRCFCGVEKPESTPHENYTTSSATPEISRLENVAVCPECNSSNIEKFNTKKRGKIMLVIVAAWFVVGIATSTLGYTWFGFAILLVAGIRGVLKDKNIIVCGDCMYSNNNKWLKRMKDA